MEDILLNVSGDTLVPKDGGAQGTTPTDPDDTNGIAHDLHSTRSYDDEKDHESLPFIWHGFSLWNTYQCYHKVSEKAQRPVGSLIREALD